MTSETVRWSNMGRRRILRRMRPIVRGLLVLLVGGVCQTVSSGQTPPLAPEAPKVAIIGASVSAGFKDGILTRGSSENDTVPLSKLLKPRFDGATVASYANEAMFLDADGSGEQQLKHVMRLKPDLLVAVDFLFWFSHGPVP